MLKKHNCEFYHSKIEKYARFPQKVAKLSKAKFSRFEGTRGGKNQIFHTLLTSSLILSPSSDQTTEDLNNINVVNFFEASDDTLQ